MNLAAIKWECKNLSLNLKVLCSASRCMRGNKQVADMVYYSCSSSSSISLHNSVCTLLVYAASPYLHLEEEDDINENLSPTIDRDDCIHQPMNASIRSENTCQSWKLQCPIYGSRQLCPICGSILVYLNKMKN